VHGGSTKLLSIPCCPSPGLTHKSILREILTSTVEPNRNKETQYRLDSAVGTSHQIKLGKHSFKGQGCCGILRSILINTRFQRGVLHVLRILADLAANCKASQIFFNRALCIPSLARVRLTKIQLCQICH
jgi:hypothetical protein